LKTQNKSYTVPVDEMGYKKKYIARKIQESEADNEIKNYKGRVAPASEVRDAPDVDEEGSVRNLSS
jgi:hypothetical protein